MFDTQKVPEMKNIGLDSIEAMWPQLDQNSIVPHKTPLHGKFQVISSIGGHFMATPVHLQMIMNKVISWTCSEQNKKHVLTPPG